MKVGVVTTSYPRFADDPAGNFVGEHVRALRSLGHEVEVIAADDERSLDHEDGDREHDAVRVPSRGLFYTGGAPDLLERRSTSIASAALFSTRLLIAIARRARQWDSIVAHWIAPSAIACLLGAPRTPLLAIAHGGDIHTLRRLRLLTPVLHLLKLRGAHLVFVSEQLRAMAAAEASVSTRAWVTNSCVQPMGIDLHRFAGLGDGSGHPPTLVIASRLVPIKGIDVALAALEHVRRRVKLVIAGDGPEAARLASSAIERGFVVRAWTDVHVTSRSPNRPAEANHDPSSVVMLGAVDTRARDSVLREASAVLVPSRVIDGRTEGTPLIALEALAAGIPVIASDVGGLRELDAIIRVPPDDPRALAVAIDRVLDAPPDRDALRASVAHLDWRHVIGKLVRNP